jgi:hypothetical protein
MTIMDIEKEVEVFLDQKLDKRATANEFNDKSTKLLNLMVTLYNKHLVRISASEAYSILHTRVK